MQLVINCSLARQITKISPKNEIVMELSGFGFLMKTGVEGGKIKLGKDYIGALTQMNSAIEECVHISHVCLTPNQSVFVLLQRRGKAC